MSTPFLNRRIKEILNNSVAHSVDLTSLMPPASKEAKISGASVIDSNSISANPFILLYFNNSSLFTNASSGISDVRVHTEPNSVANSVRVFDHFDLRKR